ncbi:MAG: hypothetical protein IIW55_05370 [Bacteroidales bacterium]|nr:hypothetical protein [Bacteroidales bacterium]
MKKPFYIILLLLSFVSCETKKENHLSPEFEEVRALMQTDPETALLKLQNFKNSESQKLSDSATQNLSNIEYSIILAEALYKNYLPQSNFDDVKAIVNYIESEKTPNSTLIIPDYLRAKAHYYYAVGLSERDNIVDACEHYLKALEVLSTHKPIQRKDFDYEKIKLISLIYTRLGELFLDNTHIDLARTKFEYALKYIELLNNNQSKAIIFKLIGNTYRFHNNTDSALYYYNKSLQTNSDIFNKSDIEKCIALILFEKGEKDSAYTLINNNIHKIKNNIVQESYYGTLGYMLFEDKVYDSAIYYLNLSLKSQNYYTQYLSATRLSAIYDILKNSEKKAYYDNITSQLSIQNTHKSIEKTKIRDVYDEYQERKNEKETLKNKRELCIIISMSLVLAFIVIILIRYKYKRTNKELVDTLDSKEKEISEFNDKLRRKELQEAKTNNKIDFEAYYNSAICQKISNRKLSDFTALSESELALLLEVANENLGNITKSLKCKYPKLKKDDFYYICLLLLNIEKNKFQYLLGKNRKTIWDRLNKIKNIMNIGENEDLYIFMKNAVHSTTV